MAVRGQSGADQLHSDAGVRRSYCSRAGGLIGAHRRELVMNHANGWMSGWMGGGMWLWTVIGVLLVVLLVVVINKVSKRGS